MLRTCAHASCSRAPRDLHLRPCLLQVYCVPLVGVWVRGVHSVSHASVLAACLRFAYSSTLPDKAMQSTDAFLLLLFPPGGQDALQQGPCTRLLACENEGEGPLAALGRAQDTRAGRARAPRVDLVHQKLPVRSVLAGSLCAPEVQAGATPGTWVLCVVTGQRTVWSVSKAHRGPAVTAAQSRYHHQGTTLHTARKGRL